MGGEGVRNPEVAASLPGASQSQASSCKLGQSEKDLAIKCKGVRREVAVLFTPFLIGKSPSRVTAIQDAILWVQS